MKKVELVAPAGNFETLEAALSHGADAVYFGVGPFNLRTHSPAFDPEDLPEVITCVQKYGKKAYAVMNTMPFDGQIPAIKKIIQRMARSSKLPDALIVSDPGVLSLCKKYQEDESFQ